jgi:thiamine kinase-like enzyme
MQQEYISCRRRSPTVQLTADVMDQLTGRASAILAPRLGAGVSLAAPHVVADRGRNIVVRCQVRLTPPLRPGPASAIVKIIKPGTALGFTDWASLHFLSEVPAAQGLMPQLYGGDEASRFYVIEDLGGSRSLEDVLAGSDRSVLRAVLHTLARRYAQLHLATVGQETRFRRACQAFSEAEAPGRHTEARQWLEGLSRVHRWFRDTDCALPAGFEEACAHVATRYAEPGPWLAFTHGDPAPTNNHVLAPGHAVRLLDFEYGGFRHALYDLTAWSVLCPLPSSLVELVSRAYRNAVAEGSVSFGHAPSYRQEWAAMVAYRALAMMSWIPQSVLDEDRSWVGAWGMRAALLTSLARLSDVAARVTMLAPLSAAADALTKTLERRWGKVVETLPRWSSPHP